MKKREITKQETRLKLLQAAKDEFARNGLLNISTVEIARRADVAHGTVFFHFQTKENLLVEVLDRELLEITNRLHALLQTSSDFESLLNTYLDFLEQEEAFFAILARETPLYSAELRRTIMGREATIRYYFAQALEGAIAQKQFQPVDIPTTLNFLFGTISYYLCLRDAFVSTDSVIRDKRKVFTKTFMQYLSK